MLVNILEKIKIPYKILEFDRFRKVSRFKELMSSPISLELMRILVQDWVTVKEGREKLQQLLGVQELCRLKAGLGIAPRTAAESTFRQAMERLERCGLIQEKPMKKEGRYVATYKLACNLLLFKGEHGNWIPTIVFTCPDKQAIVKKGVYTSEIQDEVILGILPRSDFCGGCKRKCELFSKFKQLEYGKIQSIPRKNTIRENH